MQQQNRFSSVVPLIDTKHLSRTECRAARTLMEQYCFLLKESQRVLKDLEQVQHNYDYLSGQREIDTCIYQIRTNQCRYESLLSQLQEVKNRLDNLSAPQDNA